MELPSALLSRSKKKVAEKDSLHWNVNLNLRHTPYGMLMPGRHESAADGYRYGFQGQESDDEVKGEGNSVNYKYRMHDPRVGRFFAVDPLTKDYPHYTPYSFSGNKVIAWRELEGLEEFIAIQWSTGRFFIIWDISARKRPGEGGTIQFRTRDGDIVETRPLTTGEKHNDYFGPRLKAKITDVNFREDGTVESRKYKLPSTQLENRVDENGRKYTGGEGTIPTDKYLEKIPESLIDLNNGKPSASPSNNRPSNNSNNNGSNTTPSSNPTEKYYACIYVERSCGCDDDKNVHRTVSAYSREELNSRLTQELQTIRKERKANGDNFADDIVTITKSNQAQPDDSSGREAVHDSDRSNSYTKDLWPKKNN